MSLLLLLLAFARVGATSFGGGATTMSLMRRESVERHGWLTGEEFALSFGMCQLVPGINLLGLTVLIGYRTRGYAGVAVCLLGLTVPAFVLTVLFCALLKAPALRRWSDAAMRGAMPVVIALLLETAYRLARQSLATPPGALAPGGGPSEVGVPPTVIGGRKLARRPSARTAGGLGIAAFAFVASAFLSWHPALIVLLAGAAAACASQIAAGRRA